MNSSDELYMRRVLELAELGRGKVEPNPMVGCVIVKEERIIGEGWHQNYGEAHAERNAVDSVSNQEDIIGSTVYVNLEPCSHYGKTPPCSNLLIRHQVKRVVVSNIDPNPLVDGGGIRRMKEAGIKVDVGILQGEGERLNCLFFQQIIAKTHPGSVPH
ncbi:bifunctional diaminohydroxyphosphoribosylaminopyrimidine deaminase/5-amino-6-(5-phosphoribosylamino)uracil reductase RibD [Tunicatimonas pelagia]|uniref:bifunctional diaminohydroxyphosphoribosylaminopyrimidine deaminase/5-amino-6-(5-phosphoribosylamino)uracil reductase RibD n=1 Tax=Tunicatimonas pelagia TaxID=931531 RepID=UPI00345CC380